ncbi:hypothetical protein O3M35_004133 [Rhynocoris fuscipes]|uniref:Uncharacterized protein n=1 Tax=Rhynocoris fuscipes TaxID=488301 RepID=A0AAW1CII2_9HEMI
MNLLQKMMRFRPLNTGLICMCFLIYSSALPRAKDYRPLSSEYGSNTGTDVGGSTNQANIGTYNKEPSCEELRAMWRYSKRQSRAAEITNEIPTYRDPFAFNVWEDYTARPRSAARGYARYRKPPVYGRVVHTTPYLRTPENFPERVRAFEEVARLFGTSNHPSTVQNRKTLFRFGGGNAPIPHIQMHPSQAGSFQHLKELIRNERARELQVNQPDYDDLPEEPLSLTWIYY